MSTFRQLDAAERKRRERMQDEKEKEKRQERRWKEENEKKMSSLNEGKRTAAIASRGPGYAAYIERLNRGV